VVLFAGMARLTLGKIAVLQFVYPLAAVLFDWAIYGTRLSLVQLAGVALMGAAVWSTRKPLTVSTRDQPTQSSDTAPTPTVKNGWRVWRKWRARLLRSAAS
jgi:hypothetical protein